MQTTNQSLANIQQRISQCATFSPNGLVLSADCTQEDAVDVLKYLRSIDTSMEFLIGDWVSQAKEKYGEQFTNEALQQLEFDWVRVSRAEKLAGIPSEIRNPKLSSAHHAAVLRHTSDPMKQAELLEMAAQNHLSPMETSRSARGGRLITKDEIKKQCPPRVGFYTIQAIMQDFEKWVRQCPYDHWNDDDRKMFLREVRVFTDFVETQKARMGSSV